MKKQSPGLAHVLNVWDNAPRNSYTRLNGALWSALNNAINGGLRFALGDIQYLNQNCRTGYWLHGEGLYAMACGSERGTENLSAAMAFEEAWGRPAWLWAEDTRTPERLYLGAKFTWKGHCVTITSFDDQKRSLVACTYHEERDYSDTLKVGALDHFDGKTRRIEALKRYPDDTVCVRYSAPTEDKSSKIKQRFTITHDELMAVRKQYDDQRRKWEREIKAATTLTALNAIGKKMGRLTTRDDYRHFDLEILRELYQERSVAIRKTLSDAQRKREDAVRSEQRKIEQAKNLELWLAGQDVDEYFEEVRLRVKGSRVEVTNGNSVTVKAARATLAFALKHRQKGWSSNGEVFNVDQFKVKEIHPQRGVTIGCTLIDWLEVDRFKAEIQK